MTAPGSILTILSQPLFLWICAFGPSFISLAEFISQYQKDSRFFATPHIDQNLSQRMIDMRYDGINTGRFQNHKIASSSLFQNYSSYLNIFLFFCEEKKQNLPHKKLPFLSISQIKFLKELNVSCILGVKSVKAKQILEAMIVEEI